MSRSVDAVLLVLGTIGRMTVFAGIAFAGYVWLAWDGKHYPDAENFWTIGALMVLVVGGLATLWGATDGLRWLSFKALIIRWGLVGLATGLASAAGYDLPGPYSLAQDGRVFIVYGIGGAALVATIANGAALIAKIAVAPTVREIPLHGREAHRPGPR